MTRVVIAGAGFSGLAAALFLARRGHTVTVVDRDGPPPHGSPQDDVDGWRHPGAPQARQSNALLGRACRVLTDEAPDVIDALGTRGVHQVPVVVGAGALEGEHMLLIAGGRPVYREVVAGAPIIADEAADERVVSAVASCIAGEREEVAHQPVKTQLAVKQVVTWPIPAASCQPVIVAELDAAVWMRASRSRAATRHESMPQNAKTPACIAADRGLH